MVNDAYIMDQSSTMARVLVDMRTKRCEFGGFSIMSNGLPTIDLWPTENSVHLDETKDSESITTIAFTEFKNWSFWATENNKYALNICFYLDNP